MSLLKIVLMCLGSVNMFLIYCLYRYLENALLESSCAIENRIIRLTDLWNEVQANWLKREKMIISPDQMRSDFNRYDFEIAKIKEELKNDIICFESGSNTLNKDILDLRSDLNKMGVRLSEEINKLKRLSPKMITEKSRPQKKENTLSKLFKTSLPAR